LLAEQIEVVICFSPIWDWLRGHFVGHRIPLESIRRWVMGATGGMLMAGDEVGRWSFPYVWNVSEDGEGAAASVLGSTGGTAPTGIAAAADDAEASVSRGT
jgi:hypothetical protein